MFLLLLLLFLFLFCLFLFCFLLNDIEIKFVLFVSLAYLLCSRVHIDLPQKGASRTLSHLNPEGQIDRKTSWQDAP